MGRTIRIVRVEAIRPNSMGVMAEVIQMDAVRPNSSGVMAEVIRSNAATDRLRRRVVQYGMQVVRWVRVDVFRPNSIVVMADIIRSNLTKRLLPGISSLERSHSRSSGGIG